MQIVLKLLNPKPILISFIYERKGVQSSPDIIDNILLEFAKTLSRSISAEPFNIEQFPNVVIENNLSISYNSSKAINIIFRNLKRTDSENEIENERSFPVILYFDTTEIEYVHNIVETNLYINISKEEFSLLHTLVTISN